MHQLQEQLQINLLQQTHLMQTNSNTESSNKGGGGGTKTSQAMQQLQIQQQQLISQLQLVQQRLLMVTFLLNSEETDISVMAFLEFLSKAGEIQ